MLVLTGVRPLSYVSILIDGIEYAVNAAQVAQNEPAIMIVRLRNTTKLRSTCGVTIDPAGHVLDPNVEFGGGELTATGMCQAFHVQGNANMNVNVAAQLEVNARIDPDMFVEIRLVLTPAAVNANPNVGIGAEIAGLPFFYSMKAPTGGYATTAIVPPI